MKQKTQGRFIFYLNTVLIIYLLFDVALIGLQSISPKEKKTSITAKDNNRLKKNWDVYFILMDEYASSNALRKNLWFDNNEMDSFFLNKKFSLQRKSHSNYNLTIFSMGSMLNLDYLKGLSQNHLVNVLDYNDGSQWIKNNAVTTEFKENGYDIINYSIFDLGKQSSLLEEEILPIGTRLITANTFYDRVIKSYYFIHIESKKNKQLWGKFSYYNFLDYNKKIEAKILEQANKKIDKQKFTYAHFLMPHTPYYFDSLGNILDVKSAMRFSKQYYPKYYLNNLKQANKKIRTIVNTILASHANDAAIIVMGDHGYRKLFHTNDTSVVFQNLNAVYFPDHDYSMLYDSISNVNMFRTVMNKILGTNYSILSDSSVLLIEESERNIHYTP